MRLDSRCALLLAVDLTMPLPDVKTLIRRVVKVFKKECETKRPIICFAKPMQRVVKTLGISRNQISKVMDSCDASAKSKATCSQSEPKLRPIKVRLMFIVYTADLARTTLQLSFITDELLVQMRQKSPRFPGDEPVTSGTVNCVKIYFWTRGPVRKSFLVVNKNDLD